MNLIENENPFPLCFPNRFHNPQWVLAVIAIIVVTSIVSIIGHCLMVKCGCQVLKRIGL